MTELDPEIAAMLRREGARVDPVPADAASRIGERLAVSVAAAGVAATAATGSSLAMKALPWLLTFAVGAGVIALVASSLDATPTAPATPTPTAIATATAIPPATPAPSSSIATVSVDSLPSAAPLPTTAASARVPVAASASANLEDSLVAERKILDAARKSLATGDHAGAMRALDEHAKTHANGRLVEEREAILVRTLAASGRLDEARAAAARSARGSPAACFSPP